MSHLPNDYPIPDPQFKHLRFHYQPDGAWQLTHALCGSHSKLGVLTTPYLKHVNCKRCLAKVKHHVSPDDR